MNWIKWHGAGNDFLIGDWSETLTESAWQDWIAALCHRHFGIGADGVMLVAPSEDPACVAKMRYYNSDGSRAAMCGNGIRCFAAHLHRTGRVEAGSFQVLTEDGPKAVTLEIGSEGYQITISMGKAIFEAAKVPVITNGAAMVEEVLEILGSPLTVTALKVGVPHLIVESDTVSEEVACLYGPLLERHPAFPENINVNFVRQLSEDALEVVTWERGAGLTMACGTGACASFYALYHKGRLKSSAQVMVPGGVLEIRADDRDEIFMTGPAVAVAEVVSLIKP